MGFGYDLFKIVKETLEERKKPPSGLPGKLNFLFNNFKSAYDAKDPKALSACLAEDYSGDLYGLNSKHGFTHFFIKIFKSIPPGVKPNLRIQIYEIAMETESEYMIILDFKSHLNVGGIVPVQTIDSGKISCTVKKSGTSDSWRIWSMYTMSS